MGFCDGGALEEDEREDEKGAVEEAEHGRSPSEPGTLGPATLPLWRAAYESKASAVSESDRRLKAWRSQLQQRRLAQQDPTQGPTTREGEGDEEPDSGTWKDALIARLLNVTSGGFERLVQRLLREAGFVNVTVTGRSGDGGIDGMGTYRLSLVSFPVYFQCKRYKGSVTAGTVRDFRGAMPGRGEKGLLITTDSFTRDAQNEARRDGAPPVELIDGELLCDLPGEYGLGVRVEQHVVESVTIVDDFFDGMEPRRPRLDGVAQPRGHALVGSKS